MTMTDKERLECAERIMACRREDGTIDEDALKALAEGQEISADDQVAILNLVQEMTYHDAAEELAEEAQADGFYDQDRQEVSQDAEV